MRFVSCRYAGRPTLLGQLTDGYVDLCAALPTLSPSLRELLAAGPTRWQGWADQLANQPRVELAEVELLPPIPDPRKIICVGLNYADHARETKAAIPEEPVIFNKFPTTLRAHGEAIVLPRASSEVDYEAELVVVIGRPGRHIPEAQALQHVAGYCCGHDVSARDWQKNKPQRQWLLGKSFDSFAPVGPQLVTADEIPDPHQLPIQLRLNGQTLQDSNTNQLIFSIPRLIAYISQVCTLEVGDLLFTGTPAGVGVARDPAIFLRPGDVVEVEIGGIGLLRNPVVAED